MNGELVSTTMSSAEFYRTLLQPRTYVRALRYNPHAQAAALAAGLTAVQVVRALAYCHPGKRRRV